MKKFNYGMIQALLMLVVVCVSFLTSCDNEPQHDVVLEFWETLDDFDYSQIEDIHELKKLAEDKHVANIFMRVSENNDYTNYEDVHFQAMRRYMEKRTDISPKIKGQGNLNFTIGACFEEDSLWFVAHGWTINAHLHH